MKAVEYILRIISYFVMVYFIYGNLKSNYQNYEQGNSKHKISYFNIAVISLIVAVWAVLNFNVDFEDHAIYGYQFELRSYNPGYRQSYGLGLVWDFLHLFTYNRNTMFRFMIFGGTFLTLTAYRKDKSIKPQAMLILLLSEYFLYSFAAIKQFIATGFSFMFFADFSNNKKLRSIIWIPLAIMFHEMAYILIPIFFALYFEKNKLFKNCMICGATVLLLFPAVANKALPYVFNLVPDMEQQIDIYMNAGGLILQSNYATILKGLPFYVGCIIPKFIEKEQKLHVPNYNLGNALTILSSVFVLGSFYNYWYFRFSYLFMLPVFSHIVNITENTKSSDVKGMKKLIILSLAGLTLKYMLQMYFKYGGI